MSDKITILVYYMIKAWKEGETTFGPVFCKAIFECTNSDVEVRRELTDGTAYYDMSRKKVWEQFLKHGPQRADCDFLHYEVSDIQIV